MKTKKAINSKSYDTYNQHDTLKDIIINTSQIPEQTTSVNLTMQQNKELDNRFEEIIREQWDVFRKKFNQILNKEVVENPKEYDNEIIMASIQFYKLLFDSNYATYQKAIKSEIQKIEAEYKSKLIDSVYNSIYSINKMLSDKKIEGIKIFDQQIGIYDDFQNPLYLKFKNEKRIAEILNFFDEISLIQEKELFQFVNQINSSKTGKDY